MVTRPHINQHPKDENNSGMQADGISVARILHHQHNKAAIMAKAVKLAKAKLQ